MSPDETKRHVRLVVEYDGSGFSGWQRKALARRGRPGRSVQETIEAAVLAATGEEVRVAGAGRTDAGVSALGQVVTLFTGSTIPADRFAYALNRHLPPDVTAVSSDEVPPEFHPREAASMKLYRYVILDREMRPAVGRAHLAHVRKRLDHERMQEAAWHLVGTHDFTSFTTPEAARERRTVRDLVRLDVAREGVAGEGDRIVIEAEAPGFLMHQVRIMVGSLIEVGRGRREPGWIAEVIEARDRSAAGPTAQARGLTLVRGSCGE
jgi:tRNA pseudouridine38-40 synthase